MACLLPIRMFLVFMRRILVGASVAIIVLPAVCTRGTAVVSPAETSTVEALVPTTPAMGAWRPHVSARSLTDASTSTVTLCSGDYNDTCTVTGSTVPGGNWWGNTGGNWWGNTGSTLSPIATLPVTSTTSMASEYAWVTSTHSSLTPTSSAALNTIASTSPSYSLSLSVAPFLPDPPENGQHTPLPTVSGFVPLSSVATPTSADATSATITGSRPTEVLAPAATGSRTQAWSIVLIVSCIVFLLIALVAIGLRWLWKRRARNMATASLTPFDYECHADDKPVRFWRQFALSMSSLAKEPPRPQTPDIVCAGNRRSVIDALPHGTMLYDSGTNDAAGTAALRYLVLSNGSRSVDPASYTTLDPRAFAPDAHLSVVSAYGDMAPRRASRDASVRLSLKHANFVEPHPVVLSQMAQPPGNWPYIYHNLPAPPPPHHILSQQGQHPSFPALSPQSVQTFPTHSPSHQTHMPLRLPLILSAHQYSSYHSGLSAQQGSVIGHQNGSDPSVSSRWPITQQEALVAASPGRQPRRRAEDGGVCLAGGTPPRRDRDTGVRGEHQDVAESSYTVSDGGHSDETLPPAYGAY